MKLSKEKETAEKIAAEVSKFGGRVYYVGGYVRDILLNRETDDADIEIHGVSPETVEKILDGVGRAHAVGESFGIYKIDGCRLDVALPRYENATGHGHRDFEVTVDPYAGLESAARRRDFTVNALYMDVLDGKISDFFGGLEDMKSKTLRAVSENTFADDPLRVLRGAQFSARFGFSPDEKTVALCKRAELCYLAGERVDGELKKAFLSSDKPSVFFEFLRNVNGLSYWFPEAEKLIGCRQNPEYHGEGDVWNHTMLVLDNGVKYRDKTENPYAFMLSALCHDFGKPHVTTEENGKIRSIGHETEGIKPALALLRRIVSSKATEKYVWNMVENHMKPGACAVGNAGIKATNKMFDLSCDPVGLMYLSLADAESSLCQKKTDYAPYLDERLAIYREYMSRPYVMGRDLIENGIKPSEKFTDILEYAHKLRLAGVEKEDALRQTLAYAKGL